MSASRISSLCDVGRSTHDPASFHFALKDFLDGFYVAPAAAMLRQEPPFLRDVLSDAGVADAYLAAVCDALCRRHRFAPPSWIDSAERIPERPWFAAQTHGLRMILLEESPPAFRERNLFVSANALSRA